MESGLETRHILTKRDGSWLASCVADLQDRPGELAELAGVSAGFGANIERLHYDRGRHPHRVELDLACDSAAQAGQVLDDLDARGLLPRRPASPSAPGPGDAPGRIPPAGQALAGEASGLAGPDALDDEPEPIKDVAGVLGFKVALKNRPGALAALAGLFRTLDANIIHMEYDLAADPEMAEVSVATSGAPQVSELLGELTRSGYHYHVLWRGGEDADVDHALGLSGVEAFLFKLRRLLPPERMNALEELFATSRAVRHALAEFRSASGASGEALAASEVFSNILRLAALALGTTGERFTLRLCGPVRLTPQVSLYMIACPEGANSYLLLHPGGMTMLDTNFGVYFEDVMGWLREHGFDPARIGTVLATHPDADHAGWAGRLQEQYGSRVLMHPDSARVFAEEDRTLGRGPLAGINRPFTRLVGRLSGLTPPERIEAFEDAGALALGEHGSGDWGGFPVIGRVQVADLELLVLESLGGHAAAQVFYFNPELGILFPGDYLLDAASLSPREREALSVHKSLLTSTNADSGLFVKEMGMLRELMKSTEEIVRARGGRAMVFPGHGEFYPVARAGW